MTTKKDFIFTAELISKIKNKPDKVKDAADACKKFKKDLFLEACGL